MSQTYDRALTANGSIITPPSVRPELKALVTLALRANKIKPVNNDYRWVVMFDTTSEADGKFYFDVSQVAKSFSSSIPPQYQQYVSRDGLTVEGTEVMRRVTDALVEMLEGIGMLDIEAGRYNEDNTDVWFRFPL